MRYGVSKEQIKAVKASLAKIRESMEALELDRRRADAEPVEAQRFENQAGLRSASLDPRKIDDVHQFMLDEATKRLWQLALMRAPGRRQRLMRTLADELRRCVDCLYQISDFFEEPFIRPATLLPAFNEERADTFAGGVLAAGEGLLSRVLPQWTPPYPPGPTLNLWLSSQEGQHLYRTVLLVQAKPGPGLGPDADPEPTPAPSVAASIVGAVKDLFTGEAAA